MIELKGVGLQVSPGGEYVCCFPRGDDAWVIKALKIDGRAPGEGVLGLSERGA